MTPNIDDILRRARIAEIKRERAYTVAPDTPLADVYRLLDVARPGAVVVCEEGRVVGIFTERDVLYRTCLEEIDPATPIGELMTRPVTTIAVDAPLADAVAAMTAGGHRHVPLIDAEGRAAGLLTSRDVLRFIAEYFPESVLNLPPRLHQQMARPEGG